MSSYVGKKHLQAVKFALLWIYFHADVNVFRARPVVTVDAQLILTPKILNPENKTCLMPTSNTMVPW